MGLQAMQHNYRHSSLSGVVIIFCELNRQETVLHQNVIIQVPFTCAFRSYDFVTDLEYIFALRRMGQAQ